MAVSTVNDSLDSTSLKPGDILYAHLIPIGQITLMDAILLRSFPRSPSGGYCSCVRNVGLAKRVGRSSGGSISRSRLQHRHEE